MHSHIELKITINCRYRGTFLTECTQFICLGVFDVLMLPVMNVWLLWTINSVVWLPYWPQLSIIPSYVSIEAQDLHSHWTLSLFTWITPPLNCTANIYNNKPLIPRINIRIYLELCIKIIEECNGKIVSGIYGCACVARPLLFILVLSSDTGSLYKNCFIHLYHVFGDLSLLLWIGIIPTNKFSL